MKKEAADSGFQIYHQREALLVCQVLSKIGIITLTFGIGFIYLFLWFRQRIFYVHPSLKILNTIVVRFISYIVVAVWCLYLSAAVSCYFIYITYDFKEVDCMIKDGSNSIYLIIFQSWLLLSIFIQVGLLGLFIYPVLKHTFRHTTSRKKNGLRSIRLLRRVKKAVVLTILCLISDIASLGITYAFYKFSAHTVFHTYSVNLVINQFVTILCFDHWKTILFPWKSKGIKKKQIRTTIEAQSQRKR